MVSSSSSSVFRLFVSCAAFVLGCHAHLQRPPPALLEEQQQILRWGSRSQEEQLPKLASDIFGSSEDISSASSDRNRFLDENDASLSSDELSLLDGPVLSKRRKGPTLSVVSPLEVLRQRLRLDRAKERIRENQKQIVANEELLEKIGKRNGNLRAALMGNRLQP